MFRVTKKIFDTLKGFYWSSSTDQESSPIQSLPIEMFHQHIFQSLDDSALLNLSQTSKTFESITSRYPEWKRMSLIWGPETETTYKLQFFSKQSIIKHKAALLAAIFNEGIPGFKPGYFLGLGGAEPYFDYEQEAPSYIRDTIFTDHDVFPSQIIRYAIDHHGLTHSSYFKEDNIKLCLLHMLVLGGLFDVLKAYLTEFGPAIDIEMKATGDTTALNFAFENLVNDLYSDGYINPETNSSFKTVMLLLKHGARFKDGLYPSNQVFSYDEDQSKAWRELFKLMLKNGFDKNLFVQHFADEYNNNKEFYDGVESVIANRIKL